MIISNKTAAAKINSGMARHTGYTYDDLANITYAVIERLDLQRVDHVSVSAGDEREWEKFRERDVRDLQIAAGQAGDDKMIRTCKRALAGSMVDWATCCQVLADASAEAAYQSDMA